MTQASMNADGIPKRSVGAVEMLEFCKSLDIDPVKESEMLWIAEEAFHAPLPIGWTEHQNDDGHTYFHNTSNGQSVWQHPLDGLYRDCVEYFREVKQVGGFWGVDDRIADMEEQIRIDLHDWMELFDEHGEKYYFHRRTEQSRFDDPRNEMYHDLYQRIKMVAKMKERVPLLARAPRPDEPTPYEMRLRKAKEDEEQAFLRSVCKCQALARMIAAKRRVQSKLSRRDISGGPQPLKGRLRLRLHTVRPGQSDLVLAETTPHKRHKAASKIQARMRGYLQRKHITPMLQHREFRSGKIALVQRLAKKFCARKRAEREAEMRILRAAVAAQSIYRGILGRREAKKLKEELKKFELIVASTIQIQCRMRVWLAKTEAHRRRERKYNNILVVIQGMMKVDVARKKLLNYLPLEEPIQSYFVMTPAESGVQDFMPYSFILTAAPTDGKGKMKRSVDSGYINLWKNVSPANAHNLAAIVIQKLIRGTLARIEFKRKVALAKAEAEEARRRAADIYNRKFNAARLIQTRFRGFIVRHKDVLGRKYLDFIDDNMYCIEEIQAKMKVATAQIALQKHMNFLVEDMAAVAIQRHWRGWMARQQFDLIEEQSLWPFKLWFEYTSTGPKSVFVGVQSFENPRFDRRRFFMTYGGMWMLEDPIEVMEKEVDICVDNLLGPGEAAEGDVSQAERSIVENEEGEDELEEDAGEEADADADAEALQEHLSPPLCDLCLAEGAGEPCLCCRFLMLEMASKKEGEAQTFIEQEDAEAQANPEVTQVEAQTDAIPELAPMDVPPGAVTEGTTTGVSPAEIQALVDSGQPLPPGESIDGGAGVVPPPGSASPREGDADAVGDGKPKSVGSRPGSPGAGNQDEPENEEEPGVGGEGGEGEGSQRASRSKEGSVVSPSEDGRALRRLKEGKYEAEFDDPAAAAYRKTYAGTFTDGRFERSRAANLNDLTEEQRQQVFDELEEERRMKVDELVKRQRKLAHKQRKAQRREVATLHGDSSPQKSQELRKWLRRKDEDKRAQQARDFHAMITMKNQQAAKTIEMEKYEQNLTEVRERRLRIADKRRAQKQQGMSMGETVSASMYSMKETVHMGGNVPMTGGDPSIERRMTTGMLKKSSLSAPSFHGAAPSFPSAAQRVLHRHVHHHMHHHTGKGVEDMMSGSPSQNESQLPALATDMGQARGVNSGMRRSFSDSYSGGSSSIRNRPSISGQILPTKGGFLHGDSVAMASTRKAGSGAGSYAPSSKAGGGAGPFADVTHPSRSGSGRSVSVGNFHR
eukprot:TRINITY_DN19248_c0_g2_i1.p1 TRINITY_DN19248_c0_g2~~TRINITY_DN19248_c0_g2_i1.p1  ORF type:complete len:1270 (-),score=293.74 TRINITY_DN19248_c0_g2_i1:101-3910(-)